MARLKLELPQEFPFTTVLRVRVTDVNYGGHLGNDALLGLLHEARVRFLSSYGMSEMDAWGAGLIMVDAMILFRAEAFHGQELRIDVAPAGLSRTGFDLLYRARLAENGREVARAKTGMACFDYALRRVVAVPDALKEIFPPPDAKDEPAANED
jgi:acyl-CoA thioester hydrolase